MSAITPHATPPDPVAEAPAPGPVSLGRYRLLSRLAVGGMAEIFLARVEGIGGFEKAVVIKRMIPQYARDPVLVRMFMDEARLLAKLDHPNITQVHDIGAEQGQYFFAMEYVHGEDLRTLAQAATSSATRPSDALFAGILASAARALHYVHEKRSDDGRPLNIVHRDVSPSNVLVGYNGVVKLADFGVAKWDEQQTRTTAGTLKGKLAYMSPEQARGLLVDHRSDIFSLGVLLFELTTGTRLFQGATEMAVLRQINSGEIPSPSRRRAHYPENLERIVLRALSPDRSQRHQSAAALADELERFAAGANVPWDASARSALMNQLFPRKVANWQQAEKAGLTLAEHLSRLPPPDVTGRAFFEAETLADDVTRPEAVLPAAPMANPPVAGAARRPRLVAAFAGGLLALGFGLWSLTGERQAPAPAGGPPALAAPSVEARTPPPDVAPTSPPPPEPPTSPPSPKRAKSPADARRPRKGAGARRNVVEGASQAVPPDEAAPAEPGRDVEASPPDHAPTAPPSDPAAPGVRVWDPDSVLLPK